MGAARRAGGRRTSAGIGTGASLHAVAVGIMAQTVHLVKHADKPHVWLAVFEKKPATQRGSELVWRILTAFTDIS